ncbi:conserved protein of unknown function (plasmid) [Cupriavidus taiwanensis]|uniref:Uncharacterized protein n=1 Tax=Cupriavidus taiwanensis TaxID=164546 RepID=A0A375IRG9_9BURK|nr:conserved protein of unknown function [Cupriavidus taiwanensis]
MQVFKRGTIGLQATEVTIRAGVFNRMAPRLLACYPSVSLVFVITAELCFQSRFMKQRPFIESVI